jgi:hypothetical protein
MCASRSHPLTGSQAAAIHAGDQRCASNATRQGTRGRAGQRTDPRRCADPASHEVGRPGCSRPGSSAASDFTFPPSAPGKVCSRSCSLWCEPARGGSSGGAASSCPSRPSEALLGFTGNIPVKPPQLTPRRCRDPAGLSSGLPPAGPPALAASGRGHSGGHAASETGDPGALAGDSLLGEPASSLRQRGRPGPGPGVGNELVGTEGRVSARRWAFALLGRRDAKTLAPHDRLEGGTPGRVRRHLPRTPAAP